MVTKINDSAATPVFFADDQSTVTYGSAYGERSFNNAPVHVDESAAALLEAIRDVYFAQADQHTAHSATISWQSPFHQPTKANYTLAEFADTWRQISESPHVRVIDSIQQSLRSRRTKIFTLSPLSNQIVFDGAVDADEESWAAEIDVTDQDGWKWSPLIRSIKRSE